MDDVQNEPQSFDIQNDSASAPEQEAENIEAVDNQDNDDASQEQKVTFDEAQQAKVNELIGGKVAKTHEVTRRAEAAEAQLAELQSQMPKPQEPQVPDLPDPDDFFGDDAGLKAAYAERDAAIEKRAEFNAQTNAANEQQQQRTQQQANEVAQRRQEADKSYVKNADSFGINLEQAQSEGALVHQAGLSPDVQNFIHEDAQGPLITNYLASNILELDKMRSMSPLNAAIHIANEIKPKLVGIRKTTKTPAPADIIEGQGVPEKIDARLEGVTFK